MKSTIAEKVAVDFAPLIVHEITLVGLRCGRFDGALKLLKVKEGRLTPMISGRVALRDAAAGFALAGEPGILKVLLAAGGLRCSPSSGTKVLVSKAIPKVLIQFGPIVLLEP